MSAGLQLRKALVGSASSLGARARLKRWTKFRETFPESRDMRILDLGGTVESWSLAPVDAGSVTIINLAEAGREPDTSNFVVIRGDACQAETVLADAGIEPDFDLVYSNSLLEHVGGHQRRTELAEQIRRLAPRHWVQTPYRYFPLEPHWLFPGMQFLPNAGRALVARKWPLHTRAATARDAMNHVLWTELISAGDLEFYFPESRIWHERTLGVTKSIVAISDGSS